MPFAAALSTQPDTQKALDEVCARVGLTQPDLVLAFYSAHHCDAADTIARTLNERLQPRALLGCPGESIVGNEKEIEAGCALSLWAAKWLKPVQVTPFQLSLQKTSEGYTILGRPDELDSADAEQSAVLLMGDPFTFPVDGFLSQLGEENPGLRVMGGMASAGNQPGQNPLIIGNEVVREGGVAVLLQGPLRIRAVVSQGCRPIGRHMVITKAHENIIIELGGKTPLRQLQELWPELPQRDQQLLQRGLHIGTVINEYRSDFQRGDFLIRNVMGLDQSSGALAVADRVRVGQTVQFQVRDAATADEDLHEMLQIDMSAHDDKPAAGLLFTCNGRGTRLFDKPHHDAGVVNQEAGSIPLAGFFAAGELGPVGGRNFIHGFTASVVLFEE